jgi:hypothetical protein
LGYLLKVSLLLRLLVRRLHLINLLELYHRLLLGLLLLRGITLGNLLCIILGVLVSASVVISIIVGVGARVIVLTLDLIQQLCDVVK